MKQGSSDGKFLHGQKWERFSVRVAKADFYVSPDGDDSWSGVLPSPNASNNDGPFATIERAQEAVRLLKQQVYSEKKPPIEKRFIGSPHKYGDGRDILVLIRGGYYSLDKPMLFGSDDGGERVETDLPTGAFEFHKLKDYFVTYAAYPGEVPIISGGMKIINWQRKKEKWVTDIKGMEIKKLLANGKTQTLARTPNNGYFTPTEIPESTSEFRFRKGDIKQWSGMDNNRIVMLLRWHTGVNSIANIDTENNIVRLAEPQPGIIVVPPRYYIENVEALLDAPGEWFFDANTGKLSYIPLEDISDPNDTDIVTPILSQLMIINGDSDRPVRNLRFYGLTFEATNSGNSAISFTYTTNCELADSNIRGIGNNAVQLDRGCYFNRVFNNNIQGADEGGIRISGEPYPNWVDLIHGNIISYNYVSDCGGTSIHVSNTRDTVISYNEITNTRGRTPLQVGGWSNVEVAIEGGYRVFNNHIHHVQVGSDDSGAITTAGWTIDSIISGNLIHDVNPGFFNENVAFWFDNMSSGWTAVDNIYYNIRQSEMKLCASLLSDNIYKDNFLIETPNNEPERIMEGEPEFEYNELKSDRQKNIFTGQVLRVSAEVTNIGTTGIKIVDLHVDGNIAESKKFPIIHNNTRTITFDILFHEPGEHQVAIGSTPYIIVKVSGKPLQFLYTNLNVSASSIPLGEEILVSAIVKNVRDYKITDDVNLYANGNVIDSKPITLSPGKSEKIEFQAKLERGIYKIGIGDATPVNVKIYPHYHIDIAKCELYTHCSATAKPCEFGINKVNDRYTIEAGGTDFLHAEDSYGAIYLKGVIKGDFVATLKVSEFGENVNPWYRAGIFLRNDISKSHGIETGSLGSVLVYATPKLSGIQWDEFGDGCMHKMGGSHIHESKNFPVWLKLVRHGDTFTGYISYDGINWEKPIRTSPIPRLSDAMDIGMATGTIDQIPSLVVLENFALDVETNS